MELKEARHTSATARLGMLYPQEVGELVLHQLSELSPAEGAAPTVFGGVPVEHFDERLHRLLQFRRHVGGYKTQLLLMI